MICGPIHHIHITGHILPFVIYFRPHWTYTPEVTKSIFRRLERERSRDLGRSTVIEEAAYSYLASSKASLAPETLIYAVERYHVRLGPPARTSLGLLDLETAVLDSEISIALKRETSEWVH